MHKRISAQVTEHRVNESTFFFRCPPPIQSQTTSNKIFYIGEESNKDCSSRSTKLKHKDARLPLGGL